MAKEINLVPDVKNEFIKTLKFRNIVFFACIVVASGSLLVILISIAIAGGQQGFINSKQNTIAALEQKISDYSDLSDFLTIRDQLNNISAITENKTMLSRTFNILSAIIPNGTDYINISELSIDLSGEAPTFRFDAQANAGSEPYIDYNVLDSFRKSMQYLRYDYGEYVDKNDEPIPAYCIIESGADGSTLRDATKGYYAYWLIEGQGCNPSAEDEEEDTDDTPTSGGFTADFSSDSTTGNFNTTGNFSTTSDFALPDDKTTKTEPTLAQLSEKLGYNLEEYNGNRVVRIWRTPQYADWYKKDPKEDEAYMDLDGGIHNVAHFRSSCITYSGVENENKTITWSATNESCKLVPTGEDSAGINIEDSSNGRDANEELVLRFTATITFAPEVFNFNNHHMLALSPNGRYNVTDSYSQIQSIFAERASDCDKDDTACTTTPTSGSSSNSDSSSSSNSSSSRSSNSSSSSSSRSSSDDSSSSSSPSNDSSSGSSQDDTTDEDNQTEEDEI